MITAMTTALFLLLLIGGFAALVQVARHDRFSSGPRSATLFGKLGRAADDPNLLPH
jgi:hypothetical protein